ncbi:MAG: hypothetical protein M3463_19020 [Verrucomicrobiota bacterium]|nr:hypothetical protein [Verrucomicrobiota bacterium]
MPTSEARQLLLLARADFEQARRRQPPRHARLQYALYDGGTRIYEGRGYTLSDLHKISGVRNGRTFCHQGPSITLSMPITRRRLHYSEVREAPDAL